MKIGFDGRFIRKFQTGNGMSTQQLLQSLADIDNDNEYMIYLIENSDFIRKSNFNLKQMSSLHANSHLRFMFTFPLELLMNPVDVFHALYTVPLLPFNKSTRIVLTLVEFSWFINPGDFPASRLFMAQLRMTTRYSIWRADRIISPTNYMKEQMIRHLGLPGEKIEVVPWGVNEDFLIQCGDEEVTKMKIKFGIVDDYILSVGDLHPRKNLSRLIDAFQWLKESKKIPHQLVLVGKDLYQAEEIYRRASSSRVSDSIVFAGYVTFEELRTLYQGASVFAFPSLDEGFGLPVHEAMASGVPVVTSRRGTLPEVAGSAAFFIDPLDIEDIGSAIFRIIDSSARREELIQKGLEQIKEFSWKESCKKIIRIYNELFTEGRRSRN